MESPLANIRIGKVTEQWALNQKIPTKYFETTSSTNTLAKNEAFDILTTEQQLVIYLTDEQTAGRGRKTNTWANAHIGSQLLTTWSFHIEKALSPAISPLMGLALYKAATATWPFLNFSLKAPNDLYLNNKKVSGLLLESVSQGNKYRFFIGLGFNVIASPASVDTSTSLVEELPTEAPLLAEDWICFLERLIFEFSIALQQGLEPLNSTSCKSLITALNKWPQLTEKYLSIDQSGNLQTATKKISWLEL